MVQGDSFNTTFSLLHGLGHNSQISAKDKWEHYGGIMTAGSAISTPVRELTKLSSVEARYAAGVRRKGNSFYQKISESKVLGSGGTTDYPNLTYIYTMSRHFGGASAKVGAALQAHVE